MKWKLSSFLHFLIINFRWILHPKEKKWALSSRIIVADKQSTGSCGKNESSNDDDYD